MFTCMWCRLPITALRCSPIPYVSIYIICVCIVSQVVEGSVQSVFLTSFWLHCHEALCWLVGCTKIWPPWGTLLTGGMHQDLTTMTKIWLRLPWSSVLTGGMHQDLTTMTKIWPPWGWLCWLVGCTKIWPPWLPGTVLTGGMHQDLTDWWDAPRSDHHDWPPWGTVLTGGMHQDLTTLRSEEALCWLVGCTKIWPPWLRSDRHEALCWLVGCTKIWPPWGKICADWWDAPRSDHHD